MKRVLTSSLVFILANILVLSLLSVDESPDDNYMNNIEKYIIRSINDSAMVYEDSVDNKKLSNLNISISFTPFTLSVN